MEPAILPSTVDLASLHRRVGAAAFARGVQYARQGVADLLAWYGDGMALTGIVRGHTGAVYGATAHFREHPDGHLSVIRGRCDCPVSVDCKHVVAIVVAAARAPEADRIPAEAPGPAWERSLGLLLSGVPGRAEPDPGGIPLAIHLEAAGGVRSHRPLRATLVRPGATGWVRKGVSWSVLDVPQYMADYVEVQVRVLRELRAVYRTRAYRPSYTVDDKALDLTAFESASLWPLLDQARAAGLRIIQGPRRGLDVTVYDGAELRLDITADAHTGSLHVAPVVHVGERVVTPVTFIGTQAHGVAFIDPAAPGTSDTGAIGLARLASPAPAQLQDLVLRRGVLYVPAGDEHRFVAEYYPRLRSVATVVSSDGSFVPPEVSEPTLTLRADHGAGHDLELSWWWSYEVGGATVHAPVDEDGAAAFRDLQAERAVLARLTDSLGNAGFAGAHPAALDGGPARLTGMQTVRFSTEAMPLLAESPGMSIEVSGDPADYREASDDIRIGLAVDADDDPDWFDLSVTVRVGGAEVRVADIIAALARNEPYMLLPNGVYFSLEKPELTLLRDLLEEARSLQDRPGALRISRYQVGLWDEFAEIGVVERQAQAWREQVEALPRAGQPGAAEPPSGLIAELRPYQRQGFGWLAFLWQYHLGGILADDMGLGKTVQALALISHARTARPDDPPFLIVAPTSVVPNWAAEAAKFVPGLKVATVAATSKRRRTPLAGIVAGADVVVTSYTLMRIDADDYAATSWSGVMFDEAQSVKNRQSKTYRAARLLPAPFKLAITGTPIENNLSELWALLSIVAPGLFPSPSAFNDEYAIPIEKRHDGQRLAQLRRRVRPLILRRTKDEVATDLPAKQEQLLEVALHPQHQLIYDRYLQRERQRVLGLVGDLDQHRFTILRSLTVLRQLSLHAALVDEEHARIPSAKIDALVQRLRTIVGSGHRALVFSQFTRFLGLVRDALGVAGLDHCYLDGSTRDRAGVVESFANGQAGVFLISLKAGGVGLNLTEADYVFLLDPWWNPATEAQAIDRTHRIGQTRKVMVYRLIAAGTIEEKVLALQQRKAHLFASVMDGSGGFGSGLSADDIRGLFS